MLVFVPPRKHVPIRSLYQPSYLYWLFLFPFDPSDPSFSDPFLSASSFLLTLPSVFGIETTDDLRTGSHASCTNCKLSSYQYYQYPLLTISSFEQIVFDLLGELYLTEKQLAETLMIVAKKDAGLLR